VARFHSRHTVVIEAADEVSHGLAGAAPRRMCGSSIRLTSGHREQHRSSGDMRGRFRMRKADPSKPSSLLSRERAQRINLAAGHEILLNATSDQQLANNGMTGSRREKYL
jgi:GT2 family glycosyltransferase